MSRVFQTFCDGFADDWRDAWGSLLCGVAVILAFSQCWQAPLFGYNTEQVAAGLIIRNFYFPFYGCGIFIAVMCWRRLLDATWRTPLLLSLMLLCAVSTFWSVDPSTTIRRFTALFMSMLCGYALASRFSWRRLSEVVAIAFTIMMLWSAFMAIVFPHLGRMQELFVGAWRGVWIEKNALGAAMSIGFVATAAAGLHNPSRRLFWFAMAAGMMGVLIMSTSRTSLVTMMIGVAGMVFIYLSRKGPILGIVLTWVAVTALMILAGFMLLEPDHIFLLLGKDPTLTGRTYIWDGISHVMQDRPLTGYGYGAVWSDEDPYAPLARITRIARFRAYHAHSCWYEVWLALGMLGLPLWGLIFTENWLKGLYRSYTGDGGYFALPFVAIYSLSSLTESIALGWNDMRWALLVMVFVKLSLKGDADGKEVRA